MKTLMNFISWRRLTPFIAVLFVAIVFSAKNKSSEIFSVLGWGVSMLYGSATAREWLELPENRDTERPLATIVLSASIGAMTSLSLLPYIARATNPTEWIMALGLFASTFSTSSIGCGLGLAIKRKGLAIYIAGLALTLICIVGFMGQNMIFPVKNLFLFAIFPNHGGDTALFLISSAFWFFLPPFVSSYI